MPRRESLKVNKEKPENEKITKFLSLGGGVQSSTILLMSYLGELERPDYVIFADTLWESSQTYEWLFWLERETKTPIIRVSAGDLLHRATTPKLGKSGRQIFRRLLPLFVHHENGKVGRIPTRGCTIEHKRRVLMKKQKELSGARYGQNWVCAETWLGITIDEAHRLRDSDVAWMQYRYPLVELGMTRSDCVEWLTSHGFPVPPRSSCVFCPFHSDSHWLELLNDPIERKKVLYAERKIKAMNAKFSLFKRAKSAKEFLQKKSSAEQPQEECSGFCFT